MLKFLSSISLLIFLASCSAIIVHNTNRQWFGETRAGAKQYIELLHKNNIKVMVKPQIWIWRGEFTGHLKMESEENWKALEVSYESFIMEYAELAEEMKVDMYCIGTELNSFVSGRPEFWKKLIDKIKTVYKGKLTYAENWDTFTNVPFWKELDFIGVDAYFPLTEEKTPTPEALKLAWQPHKEQIFELHKTIKKPILFTEYGYRSTNFTAKFAGGFIWKWFHAHDRVGGHEDPQFTPQNKPAEALIKKKYSNSL